MTAPTRSTSSSSCRRCGRGQLAQRFDGDGEPAAGAPLVPHPADHAVDEQDRVVAGLARRGERAGRGRARVQPLPGLTRDDVRRRSRAAGGRPRCGCGRRPGVAGHGPARLAVQLDVLQLTGQLVEQLGGAPRRDAEPPGEVLRRGRAVGVQVARDQGAQGRLAVVGPEAGQPAVRVGVGHLAAPVRPEAEHAAVRGRARELAPARPLVLERVHRPLDRPRAGTVQRSPRSARRRSARRPPARRRWPR